MYYAVKAKYIPSAMPDFYKILTDGTILNQKPDGKEIVESMRRAKITESGVVQWTEQCFCPTPLKHERETVLDRFFTDVETEEVSDYVEYEGESFMELLEKQYKSST